MCLLGTWCQSTCYPYLPHPSRHMSFYAFKLGFVPSSLYLWRIPCSFLSRFFPPFLLLSVPPTKICFNVLALLLLNYFSKQDQGQNFWPRPTDLHLSSQLPIGRCGWEEAADFFPEATAFLSHNPPIDVGYHCQHQLHQFEFKYMHSVSVFCLFAFLNWFGDQNWYCSRTTLGFTQGSLWGSSEMPWSILGQLWARQTLCTLDYLALFCFLRGKGSKMCLLSFQSENSRSLQLHILSHVF